MNASIYRNFLAPLKKLAFEEVHILLHDDISPQLKEYVRRLNNVKYMDGGYHYLYGNMKKIIASFVIFFSDTIDCVVKEQDKYTQVISRKELIRLTEITIQIHQTSQAEFAEEYLPATSPLEQETYEEVEKEYKAFMERLFQFKENLNRLDKSDKVEAFAKTHFQIALVQMNKVLCFAQNYLGKMLTDRVEQIRVSIEEILLRLRNNLKRVYEETDAKMDKLMNSLYDKNKESMNLSRRYKRCSLENADINKSIEIIRSKIENYEGLPVTSRLEEEVEHWNNKVSQLDEVRNAIREVKRAQAENDKQEEMYNKLRTIELPGTKQQCFLNMGENFARRRQYLEEKMDEVAKFTLTIFACGGSDRIVYTDNLGPFVIDEFGHQVYSKNYYLEDYHVNCAGNFVEVKEEAYYFDELGRYILDEGEKTYRCAPCTSQYKLMETGLLQKVTKDCGHSERPNVNCRMEPKDLTDVEILPMTEPVDIKNTLSPEVAKYLWDSFGSVLPDALVTVGLKKPKNPIHHLAHAILARKYEKTRKELLEKVAEADKYRSDTYKERKEKAIAETKAWKAKQVKRRKPEESDDAEERGLYEQQFSQQEYIVSLNYYN